MSDLLARLGRFAATRRRVVLALYAAISVALVWSASTIRLETSLAGLLPEGTASADDLRDLLDAGGTVDRIFVSISLEPREPDPGRGIDRLVAAAERFTVALSGSNLVRDARYGVGEEDLAAWSGRAVAHLPVLIDAGRAGAVAERLTRPRIRDAVARLRDRASMPGFSGAIEGIAARDPLGLLAFVRRPSAGAPGFRPDPETGLFLSADGGRLLVLVEAAKPPTEVAFARRLVEVIEAAEARARDGVAGAGRLRFDVAGGHLFALEDERRIRHDATLTSLVAIVAVAGIYLLVVRRAALWIAILAPLLLSTVWTLGLAAIYPGRLNMVTVAFAAILLGIGDDAMVHLYLREREARRRGLAPEASTAEALGAAGPAVVTATLTTAAAFAALGFVHFRGLAELGIIGAMGMLSLLVGSLVFFPAAMALLARREEGAPSASLRLPVSAILALYDRLRPRRAAVIGAAALLTAGASLAAASVRIATDLRAIRGDDPAAAALERVLGPFGGAAAETLVVVHGGRDAGGESARERVERGLDQAAALAVWCREAAEAGAIAGCDDPSAITPPLELQRTRHAALGALPWAGAADVLQAEATAAGVEPRFFASFLDAARRYADFDAVRIDAEPDDFGPLGVPQTRVFLHDAGSAAPAAAAIRTRLDGAPARLASVALVSADLSRVIEADFRRAAAIVAVVVAAICAVAFRRPRLALLALTPVVLGTIWTLGAARILGVEMNLMTLMGMPVVFGLGVDYGVYVVDRWAREGRDPRAALEGVGPAVLVTGLTTIAGFAALLSADLAGLRSLGFAVVAGAAFTLAAALTLLPLLLPAGGRERSDGGDISSPA